MFVYVAGDGGIMLLRLLFVSSFLDGGGLPRLDSGSSFLRVFGGQLSRCMA